MDNEERGYTAPFWVLHGHEPAQAGYKEWTKFLSDYKNCQVGLDKLSDEVEVSTVFLARATRMNDKRPLFETMVFGGPLSGNTERYYTWDEAEAGHKEVVETVKATIAEQGEDTHFEEKE